MEHLAALSTTSLTPHLARLGRRLRLRDGWRLAQDSLWGACATMVLIQLAGRLWPISTLWLWTLAPLALWGVGIAAISLFRPMSPSRVARRTDIELGLKERLSTAVMLEGWISAQSSNLPTFQSSLVALQREDALAAAQGIEPRRAFPLSWQRRPLFIASLLVVATVVLAALPNRMDAVLAERAEAARAAQEQAARIDQLAKELAGAQELLPEDRAELQRQLAELAQRLRDNQGDREQALADLSKLEDSLRRAIDPHADAQQAALDALAAQLQALAKQQDRQQAGAAPADPANMDETLQSLAEQLAGANETERQALAGQLNQMAARAAQSGNASLAQALADMAQSAQAGNADAASQAAQAASDAMRSEQGELAGQAARQRALAQLQQSRQSIAASTGQGQQSAGQGQAQEPGQGQGQGQGQGKTQGSGQGGQGAGGQGGGGQGTKADQLPPGTGSGQADRPQGEGRPGEVGALEQQIYAPRDRGPGSGDELTISGQDTGQGESDVRERTDPLPGSAGEALVPYYEVYFEYLDAANEAMEQSYIPSGLKDVVREYFSRLEP